MINKCLNPQMHCFSGQCSYCNKQIEKKLLLKIWNKKKYVGFVNVEIQRLLIGITIG
jgi:hypothetical protein